MAMLLAADGAGEDAAVRLNRDADVPRTFVHAGGLLAQLGQDFGGTAQVAAGGALTHEFAYDTKGAPLSLPREAHLFDEEYYPLGTTLPGALPGEPRTR